MFRVGQNRIYTPYVTVYLVISLPKIRIYIVYIWFWQTLYMLYIYIYIMLHMYNMYPRNIEDWHRISSPFLEVTFWAEMPTCWTFWPCWVCHLYTSSAHDVLLPGPALRSASSSVVCSFFIIFLTDNTRIKRVHGNAQDIITFLLLTWAATTLLHPRRPFSLYPQPTLGCYYAAAPTTPLFS